MPKFKVIAVSRTEQEVEVEDTNMQWAMQKGLDELKCRSPGAFFEEAHIYKVEEPK